MQSNLSIGDKVKYIGNDAKWADKRGEIVGEGYPVKIEIRNEKMRELSSGIQVEGKEIKYWNVNFDNEEVKLPEPELEKVE